MPELLADRVAWYIVGPLMGLLVAGLFLLANKPLGASGAYVQVLAVARRRSAAEPWRVWYFVGIAAGAVLATVLQGGVELRLGYEPLTALLPRPVVLVVLLVAGTAMGYGARVAGGCTSGHGLCGTSTRSPASFAATATLMVTAVAVTFAVHAATGGAW